MCLLGDEQFRTVLIELEGVINQRPLTYVSDQADSVSPLTPAHFFSTDVPLCEPWIGSTATYLRSSRSHVVLVSNKLINRWKHEYLHTLRTWRNTDTHGRRPSVGDIVLVKEGPRRAKWPLAVISKVISDEVVEIRLRGHHTRRASKLIYPLEADPPWGQGAPLLSVPAAAAISSSSDAQCLQEDASQSEDPVPDDEDAAVPVRTSRRGRAIKMPARFLD